MTSLEHLKGDLVLAREIGAIVHTMKVLAAVGMRQYEQAVEVLDAYEGTVERGLIALFRGRHVDLTGRAVLPAQEMIASGGRLALIVVGSDQGLCGRFNQDVVRHAVVSLQERGLPLRVPLVLALGGRTEGALERAGCRPQRVLDMPVSADGIGPVVEEVLTVLDEWRTRRAVERVVVVAHERFIPRRDAAGGEVTSVPPVPRTTRLLPPASAWLQRLGAQPWPSRSLPAWKMPWEELLARLLRQHVFCSLYRVLALSLAAENESRLRAMQRAEDNVEKRLDVLTRAIHVERRELVTRQMLDVVAGYEASVGVASPSRRRTRGTKPDANRNAMGARSRAPQADH